MQINKTFIDGLFVLNPKIYCDDRGHFFESYNKNTIDDISDLNIVQDNESRSYKGVIRGLHFQAPPYAQTKIFRCVYGKVLDVVVDIRKKSKTFGKFFSIELSSENKKQIFIPKGFAHGFQTLSDEAIVNYKVDNYYNTNYEFGIIWNDQKLSIDWNKNLTPYISKKDHKLASFKNFKSPF